MSPPAAQLFGYSHHEIPHEILIAGKFPHRIFYQFVGNDIHNLDFNALKACPHTVSILISYWPPVPEPAYAPYPRFHPPPFVRPPPTYRLPPFAFSTKRMPSAFPFSTLRDKAYRSILESFPLYFRFIYSPFFILCTKVGIFFPYGKAQKKNIFIYLRKNMLNSIKIQRKKDNGVKYSLPFERLCK